jgi:hypothetical protein
MQMQFFRRFLVPLAVLAGAAGSAHAGFVGAPGGVVGYGPDVAAVPTLSAWVMLALGLLLLVLAYRVLRTRANGRLLANLTLVGGAVAAAAGGHALIDSAQAIAVTDVHLSAAAGGSVAVNEGVSRLINATSSTQVIRSIAPAEGMFEDDPESNRCTVGLPVPPAAFCLVWFRRFRLD